MNYNKKTVKDLDVKGKKVLCRCDFNVPQDKASHRLLSPGQAQGRAEGVPDSGSCCQAPERAAGLRGHFRHRHHR